MIEEKVGHSAKDTKEAKMSMKANDHCCKPETYNILHREKLEHGLNTIN